MISMLLGPNHHYNDVYPRSVLIYMTLLVYPHVLGTPDQEVTS